MRKVINEIKVWASEVLAKWNKDAKEHEYKRAVEEARERIGVVVKCGKLFLAYNDQPLIEESEFNKPLGDIVEEARITYITTNH